jgi:hypothetical protein
MFTILQKEKKKKEEDGEKNNKEWRKPDKIYPSRCKIYPSNMMVDSFSYPSIELIFMDWRIIIHQSEGLTTEDLIYMTSFTFISKTWSFQNPDLNWLKVDRCKADFLVVMRLDYTITNIRGKGWTKLDLKKRLQMVTSGWRCSDNANRWVVGLHGVY